MTPRQCTKEVRGALWLAAKLQTEQIVNRLWPTVTSMFPENAVSGALQSCPVCGHPTDADEAYAATAPQETSNRIGLALSGAVYVRQSSILASYDAWQVSACWKASRSLPQYLEAASSLRQSSAKQA